MFTPDRQRIFVVTDGAFSMEGDVAPLPDIVEIARKAGASVIFSTGLGYPVVPGAPRACASRPAPR